MPADGEITIRSIIREHNRIAMPRGFLRYCFQENSDLYGPCLTNGLIASGGLSLGRFMYYGRLTQALHMTVPITFVAASMGTSYFVFMKRKEKEEEESKKPLDKSKYLTLKSRVPMTEEEMKYFKDNPQAKPLSEDQQSLYGVTDESKESKDSSNSEDEKK